MKTYGGDSIIIPISGSSAPVSTPGATFVPTATPMINGATPAPTPMGNGYWGTHFYVYDEQTDEPIEGAVVFVNSLTDNTTITDANGECSIVVYAHDMVSIVLTVTKTDYTSYTYNYNFINTGEREEIALAPEPESTSEPTPTPGCISCDMNVSGHVTDYLGEPLEGATVYLLASAEATTDADGYYEFTTRAIDGPGCPIGDTYISVNQQGDKFIPVTCGDYIYNFSGISPENPQQTPSPTSRTLTIHQSGNFSIAIDRLQIYPADIHGVDSITGETTIFEFSSGTIVNLYLLSQTPPPGGFPLPYAHFSGWTGDITTSATQVEITMDSNKTITAVFITEGTIAPTGDVNGDGSVDIVDALLTVQNYVGLDPVAFNPEAADVNCDGSVDIVDTLLIAQYYVGLITEFCS